MALAAELNATPRLAEVPPVNEIRCNGLVAEFEREDDDILGELLIMLLRGVGTCSRP